jgi:outer membrane lipoprotein-sorting protein
VKLFRTLSTTRLILLVLAIAVLAAGVAAIAVASGGSTRTPPPKPLAQALHDSLAASAPAGVTARIKFTNNLFPSGALTGNLGSALMSGGSGRLWATNDGRGRIELQSDAGDVQIVWTRTDVAVFDASSNTVYRAKLPAHSNTSGSQDQGGVPTVAQLSDFLAKLGAHVDVSGAHSTNVAHQAAYSVRVSPKHDGGLLGAGELAWDAARGVPLRIGIYAQGSSTPVLELKATKISYGAVPSSDVVVSPPANAKSIDLGSLGTAGQHHQAGSRPEVTGLPAVQAAAGFPVVAPDALVGLPRQDVRLVGGSGSKAALAVYGHGLGAIVVVERKAGSAGQGGPLGSLPSVAINGATGHELATQLGTALTWSRGGVAYVLAGSVPAAAAEAAARELK